MANSAGVGLELIAAWRRHRKLYTESSELEAFIGEPVGGSLRGFRAEKRGGAFTDVDRVMNDVAFGIPVVGAPLVVLLIDDHEVVVMGSAGCFRRGRFQTVLAQEHGVIE